MASLPAHTFEPLDRDYLGFIFDCDGTLADSMPLHLQAWQMALASYGAGFDFSWELMLSRAGKSLEVTVGELNLQFGTKLDPDAVAALQRATYAKLLPQVQAIEPVVAFVRSVSARFPLAVASGSDARTVEATLDLLELRAAFPVVVTAADVIHGKPAPDMFLLAAERIGVAPVDCVVFEDSPLGIEAAKRAGMGSVLVRRLLPP
jgi:HAD superfamily hydrolase (TIGR01509 family)